jgi:pantoate--beta-alanine ligase
MQIIDHPHQMQEAAMRLRIEGKLIALVPTSGALHAGHAALVARAREQADVVVLSSMVNPAEFGPNEDFQLYPRTPEADEAFCRSREVDILFRPAPQEIFPDGYAIQVSEQKISKGLCGISRPHYFRGVCTYHTRLFNLVRPDQIVLGWKDAQKSAVLRQLVDELYFPIRIEMVDTQRDADGLPYSGRNAYFDDFQRPDALTLYHALLEGKKLADAGLLSVDRILAEVTHHISLVRRLRVIYVAAVDPLTMEPLRGEIRKGRTLIIASVWCDEVRMLDNILL